MISGCNKTASAPNKVLIYGHGGMGFDVLNAGYTANTIRSFEAALDLYDLDGIEIDLQYTKDGDIVVFHDDFLEKSTQCKGRINDVSLDSACNCIYRKQFNNRYDIQIISLDSFLSTYAARWRDKHVSLNIQGSFSVQFSIDTLAARFVQKLNRYHIDDHISVECGSTYFLRKIKEYDSTRLCYVVGKQSKLVIDEILDFNLDGIVCRFSESDERLQQLLVDSGKHITFYDLTIQRDYSEANWAGVRSMQTDNPAMSLKYFGRD